MAGHRSLVEESPFTPFLKRLTLYSSRGPFLDGYILVIVGTALIQLDPQLKLDNFWNGLIDASALVGLLGRQCCFRLRHRSAGPPTHISNRPDRHYPVLCYPNVCNQCMGTSFVAVLDWDCCLLLLHVRTSAAPYPKAPSRSSRIQSFPRLQL